MSEAPQPPPPASPGAPLRQRAEQRLAQQAPAPDLSGAQVLHLLHELQVHQIELQLQNEALQASEQAAREALDRLAALHETLEQQVAERTAELVLARDAAQAATQAKGAFLANMSHELRTPLHGVKGMIGLALAVAQDSRQIDWLNKAARSADHLLAVINNVLDLSQIEAERLRLTQTELRVREVLDLLTSLLSLQAQQKGLTLEMQVAPDLMDRRFLGDSLRLGQILLNLAGNAIKFTDQGSVQVRVSLLSDNDREACLRFEVRDTGIGIASADLPRLFTAFEQVDASASRQRGGTGLGLVICQRMVQMMGGDMGVSSQPGTGSQFWFTVCLGVPAQEPAQAPAMSADMALAQLIRDHAGAQVLLVDDNPVNQEIMCALLENAQLKVSVADDGALALACAQTLVPALILMDLQMPVLDGFEATRAMRRLPSLAHTPIIALTASSFDQDWQHCQAAGMDDHLSKPVDAEVVYGKLLSWLRNRRTGPHCRPSQAGS